MAKTLKDFLEGYLKVKSADEQKFIDKHVTAKNPDRNGNGDDVFKGSTKAIDRRKERKGYNPGEDEKVYEGLSESTYEFDVSGEDGKAGVDKFVKHANSKGIKAKVHTYDGPAGGNPVVHLTHKDPKVLHSYVNTHMYPVHDISKHKINEALKGNQHKIDANKNGKVDAHDFKLLRKKKVAEEVEELDEVSAATKDSYAQKAGKQLPDLFKKSSKSADGARKYYNRKNTVRKIANEEAEQIDELSKKTMGSYIKKAIPDAEHKEYWGRADRPTKGQRQYLKSAKNRRQGINKAIDKLTNEEAEQVDEKLDMKKASMGTVIKDFQKSDAPQFQGKSQKKRQVMAIAAKLSAERGGKPLRKEERLQNRIDDLSEVHQRTIMHVFEKLNEDNKSKFLEACDTPEGVEQMLDFAINHRGE
jgi:hypothetical protein